MKKGFLMFVASFLLSGMMYAQDFHWEGWDYNAFNYHMSVIGRVYFDGELQNRSNIEVATFVGGELRGTKYLYEAVTDEYYYWGACYYNSLGETFTFQAYDHENGVLYDLCDTELVGQEGGYVDFDNPIQMNFTRTPGFGPDYPWQASTNYSGTGMAFQAQVQINGTPVARATYEVGAFCGDECRGNSNGRVNATLVDFTADNLGYFAFMNIMGNDGDQINFYLYDKQNSEAFPGMCFTTVELENGAEVGLDIFNDGIFVLNFVTEQQFHKDIEAYDPDPEVRDHYYLIASPIGEVNPEDVTNMLSNDYDLYYFDQAEELEWINYKAGEGNINPGFGLVPGKGYLYANSGDVRLTFTGYPYDGDGKVTLEMNDNVLFKGWNLVGNPFPQTANIGERSFYRMNGDGTEVEPATEAAIDAMEGIFVIANTDDETLTFTPGEPSTPGKSLVLSIVRNRGNVIDKGIVRFDNGDVLPKFQINPNNTKVYFPVDNKDYAVVNADESGEMPVNFKAAQNGNYTINVSMQEVSLRYLHLVDNMTGADVDLLKTPSYTFAANVADYASRFKLVFVAGQDGDDTFAFYNNGNWIVNNDGEAVLQVIDVTGRVLSSEQINGSVSKHIQAAPGVYMLRLVNGNDVKVQKIVVR